MKRKAEQHAGDAASPGVGGAGLKLLEKMGWRKGEGLGREKRGIAAPIEVQLRPQRMGLAYNGFAEKKVEPSARTGKQRTGHGLKDRQRGEDASSDEEGAARRERRDSHRAPVPRDNWRAGKDNVQRRPRAAARDIIFQELGANAAAAAEVKIIDMRGRAATASGTASERESLPVVGDGGALDESANEVTPLATKYLPELLYNIQLIVGMASGDLHTFSRSYRQEKERLAQVVTACKQLESSVASDKQRIGRLDDVIGVISVFHEQCVAKSRDPTGSVTADGCGDIDDGLDDVMQNFEQFLSRVLGEYAEEYRQYSLGMVVAAGIVTPLKYIYAQWNPFMDPKRGRSLFAAWRLLLAKAYGAGQFVDPALGDLLVQVWLPRVRSVINNEWSVRDAQSLMAILKAWKDVAPDFVLDNVLYQLVLPKIEREVNAWNPRVDREPIHSWLFPWLSHLYDDIRLLFPAIRHKMGKALEDWDPLADSSALAVLAPWHDVFERSDYDALLLKSVVPKLSLMLRSFEINPADQKLDAIYAYLRWKPFLAPSTFYDVLDGAFFHRWLHTLYLWLHSAGAEVQEVYTDVTLWYSEWKGVLPAEVCTDHRVQRHFTTALDMLNFAMSEGTVEGFAGGIYALAQAPAASELPSRRGLAADSRAPGTRAPDSVTLSFKDALAMFAEKHGIVFLPTSRVHERSGKPLYSFGSTNVYVDGTLVYAEIGVTRTRPGFADGLFEPVTFEQLLEHENVKDRI